MLIVQQLGTPAPLWDSANTGGTASTCKEKNLDPIGPPNTGAFGQPLGVFCQSFRPPQSDTVTVTEDLMPRTASLT